MKPILKWVGGKTQIIDKLLPHFKKDFNNYHEIFLGGGSVLFAFLINLKKELITINGTINAYDLNEPLIYVYKNIQSSPTELYIEIQTYINEFNKCTGTLKNRKPTTIEEAKSSKESYYYWIRKEYNSLTAEEKKGIKGSALFIFLNKTCFRGVFRVGPNGFNVPYGNYNSPEIINKDHLEEIHNLIQNVNFICADFSVALTNIEEDDFIYMDPPYVPEKETSFVGYTLNGFNKEEHIKLFNICNKLNDENKHFMMSNSDVTLVRENFISEKYNIKSISCKRSINSKNPESKTNEVIIINYNN
jgi:DNA adenine methylase